MRDSHKRSIESKINWDYGKEVEAAGNRADYVYGDEWRDNGERRQYIIMELTKSFQTYLNGIGMMAGIEFSHLPDKDIFTAMKQPPASTYGVASIGNSFERVELSVYMIPYSETESHYSVLVDFMQPAGRCKQPSFFTKHKEDLLEIAAIPGVNAGSSSVQGINYEKLEKMQDANGLELDIRSNMAFMLALVKMKEKLSTYKP
ncbi:MAG: hypothetical protein WC852_05745 [Candidatus Nanoarchaeia archaeon]|jgi:hypothetical protein